ncbi:MAG: DNA methyltransferase [Limnochordia bacterium]
MEKVVETYLSTSQAAAHLGVSVSTIYRMVDQGVLLPIKTPGGQRRFGVSDLDAYKNKSHTINAPQNPRLYQKTLFDDDFAGVKEGDAESTAEKTEEEKSVVDPRNKLNDLTGKEWLPETKSFFFQKGLGARHPHAQIERQHPAPFSFQDVGRLIAFFTKGGQYVLDPFGGVGSTAKACALLGRKCTSIELSDQWHELSLKRLETEVGSGESENHTFIRGDCREILHGMDEDTFDFMVTSPPYWSILNKKADHKVKKERLTDNLATNYSDDDKDLGNIENYEVFLEELVKIFLQCGKVIKTGKYMAIVVSDFRHKSEFVSFHSDLIQRLNKSRVGMESKLSLQGVKVLLQNHKSLLPYGYPYAYVENIHHQYILLFRKIT